MVMARESHLTLGEWTTHCKYSKPSEIPTIQKPMVCSTPDPIKSVLSLCLFLCLSLSLCLSPLLCVASLNKLLIEFSLIRKEGGTFTWQTTDIHQSITYQSKTSGASWNGPCNWLNGSCPCNQYNIMKWCCVCTCTVHWRLSGLYTQRKSGRKL